MDSNTRLPIGITDFAQLRSEGYIYVDKTEALWPMLYDAPAKRQYIMNPSGFGKTLTLSLLKSYFEGRRELFQGLRMEQLEASRDDKAWTPRPVLHMDFNQHVFQEPEDYTRFLNNALFPYEKEYGVEHLEEFAPGRLVDLLVAMHDKTGHRPAILIDSFDKPVAETFRGPDKALFRHYGNMQKTFYGTLSRYERSYHLAVLTTVADVPKRDSWNSGETKRHLEFTALPRFGITLGELETHFPEVLQRRAELQSQSVPEFIEALRGELGCYYLDKEPPTFCAAELFASLRG